MTRGSRSGAAAATLATDVCVVRSAAPSTPRRRRRLATSWRWPPTAGLDNAGGSTGSNMLTDVLHFSLPSGRVANPLRGGQRAGLDRGDRRLPASRSLVCPAQLPRRASRPSGCPISDLLDARLRPRRDASGARPLRRGAADAVDEYLTCSMISSCTSTVADVALRSEAESSHEQLHSHPRRQRAGRPRLAPRPSTTAGSRRCRAGSRRTAT